MSHTTRFAPSPTGLLHLGHAFAALFAAQAAGADGSFLLRIEDIDRTRCRDDYIAALEEDLNWLGLRWGKPVMRQSEHLADYAAALARLQAQGHVYPCFCSRKAISAEIARAGSAPHAADGTPIYPGTCRNLSARDRRALIAGGTSYAWRMDAEKIAREAGQEIGFTEARQIIAVDPALLGDVVLARISGDTCMQPAYHLAVAVDDARQEITLVTRAQDLRASCHPQRLLQIALGLPAPRYLHHPLLTDPKGAKLSKRDGADTLRALRASGRNPEQLRAGLLEQILPLLEGA